jgi:hypothetical protein
MRRIADDYLRRLRRSVRGMSPDVVAEVEREIEAHIDDALAAREAPSVGDLLDVLERLGPPEDYARDLGLYLMVDRGYREWSVPHMVRSTAFWALSTVAGAVVVGIFGLLYVAAASLAVGGAVGLFGPSAWLRLSELVRGQAGAELPVGGDLPVPGLGSLAVGVMALAGLTAVVRWFVGQYVRSARPHTAGAEDADSGWVDRSSRRILATALSGLALTLLAGLASGVYRVGQVYDLDLPGDYFASPLALLSGLGMLVFLLAPVLGLIWTAAAERQPAGPVTHRNRQGG